MKERNFDADARQDYRARIDYGELSTAVGYRMRRARGSLLADLNERLSLRDMRPTDFSVLTIIANNPGLKQSEVAEALGIQQANFVAVIKALEKSGFAERRKSDADRRVQSLHITSSGITHLAEVATICQQHERYVVDQLGGAEARDQLIALLSRLNP